MEQAVFWTCIFWDSLTGWKINGNLLKTINAGINWTSQILPSGGNIIDNNVYRISKIDNDTLWCFGGYMIVGGSPPTRGILHRTINSGDNWLFQLPDTSVHIVNYFHGQFITNKIGWAYHTIQGGIHTVTGGDTIWYTGIQQLSNNLPASFILKQNYPNPFNPRTVIGYSLKKSAFVKLIAYDIAGREVQRMVDSYQQAGEYEVDFMGKFTSTGVYFYRIEITDEKVMLFTGTKKMILLK